MAIQTLYEHDSTGRPVKVTRRSIVSGKLHTRTLDVHIDQIRAWERGKLIQDAMPEASSNDREFLLSGITPEEWNMFMETSADETLENENKDS